MRFSVLLAAFLALGGCGPDPMDLAVSAMNRGLVELESGRPGAAVLLFDDALTHAPDWHEAKVNRTVALFHSGDPDFYSSLDGLGDDPRALFLCRSLRPAQSTLRLLGETVATDGAPIRGRYADWGPLARAVNAFPGVDLPPASSGNRIDLRLEPGSGMGTMEDGGPARNHPGEPAVVVRAGRRRAESPTAFMGDAPRIDYLQVRWPSGRITAHGALPVNETLVIRESNP